MSYALSTTQSSSIDRLRSADLSLGAQAALIGGTALLTAVLAQFEFRIYLWEVPLTLQTLAVYGSGLFLGRRNAALAMGLYLVLGLVLPFYAGAGTGVAHLLGATGGYLLAFPVLAFLAGALTESNRTAGRVILTLALSSVVLFAAGSSWLHFAAGHATWTESLFGGWFRFIPWDLAKLGLVGAAYLGARRMGN